MDVCRDSVALSIRRQLLTHILKQILHFGIPRKMYQLHVIAAVVRHV